MCYQSPEKRLEMAQRLKRVAEAEIAGGDTRSVFRDILEMSNRIIEEMEEPE